MISVEVDALFRILSPLQPFPSALQFLNHRTIVFLHTYSTHCIPPQILSVLTVHEYRLSIVAQEETSRKVGVHKSYHACHCKTQPLHLANNRLQYD